MLHRLVPIEKTRAYQDSGSSRSHALAWERGQRRSSVGAREIPAL